jgi:predicted nucleic acid-binding protein
MKSKHLIDTSILVDCQRGKPAALAFVAKANGAATSAICVMEFNRSVLVVAGKALTFAQMFPSITVLPFTKNDALLTAKALGKNALSKAALDAINNDAMIAATAINRGYVIASNNAGDFEKFTKKHVTIA